MESITLNSLPIGKTAYIEALSNEGSIKRRLNDLGFNKGARIEKVGVSPLGDPSAYLVCGAIIALRKKDAEYISVSLKS